MIDSALYIAWGMHPGVEYPRSLETDSLIV